MNRMRPHHLALALSFSLLAGPWAQSAQEHAPSTPPRDATKQPGPGLTKGSAIEVCTPRGEYAYLDRLRCAYGTPVQYERQGAVGFRNEPKTAEDKKAAREQMGNAQPVPPGQKDFHMLDGYEVRCVIQKITLYLDMYHCPEPKTHPVPAGFTLAKSD